MKAPLYSYDLEFTAQQAQLMQQVSGQKLTRAIIEFCVKECKKKGVKASVKAFLRAKKKNENGIIKLQAGDVRIRYRVKEVA
ncbi:hypothetical protein [Siphonobacter sp. SORGH_AS_1065]|uniref:hypothetical protein n=1 Tax=Siphonobacter sp. SORGH_AS_1065 TaxID=3041795 RepID=UPI00278AFAB3|nr:hypothetical protein [Siphonobacter sp. SORGH_AS_1065]MDQ1085652.1 hypothetical protein [Siphonobacter sp. SORGH_AS_1065]